MQLKRVRLPEARLYRQELSQNASRVPTLVVRSVLAVARYPVLVQVGAEHPDLLRSAPCFEHKITAYQASPEDLRRPDRQTHPRRTDAEHGPQSRE
jgi:hypothetical protein